MNLVLNVEEVRSMNKATFDAFIESGKYAYSKTEAYNVFGKVQIDLLLTNNLLKNTSELPGKCKFLLSDIITGFELFKKMENTVAHRHVITNKRE